VIEDSLLRDHDKLDLESAGRITYRIEQSFRYDYDAPVTSVRQRLVVVPPARRGDLYRRAHRVAVTGAAARRRVVRDAAGNTIVRIHAPLVVLCFRRSGIYGSDPGGQGVAGSNPVSPTAERSPLIWT
jgi:Bacterial transglutaminase-like N-terminal region